MLLMLHRNMKICRKSWTDKKRYLRLSGGFEYSIAQGFIGLRNCVYEYIVTPEDKEALDWEEHTLEKGEYTRVAFSIILHCPKCKESRVFVRCCELNLWCLNCNYDLT